MENLPEDLIPLLFNLLSEKSKASVLVLAYVSKPCYRLVSRYARMNNLNRRFKSYEVAAEGSLNILKWIKSIGYHLDDLTCDYAAKNGHLGVLKFARSCGSYWSARTCSLAASNGHLDVLKWARSNGCE